MNFSRTPRSSRLTSAVFRNRCPYLLKGEHLLFSDLEMLNIRNENIRFLSINFWDFEEELD